MIKGFILLVSVENSIKDLLYLEKYPNDIYFSKRYPLKFLLKKSSSKSKLKSIYIKILPKYAKYLLIVKVEGTNFEGSAYCRTTIFRSFLVKTHYFSTLSLRQGPNIRSLNHFKVMSGRCWITKAVDGKLLTSSKNYSHVKPFECWGSTSTTILRFIFNL